MDVANADVSGEMVGDLIVATVESRFGSTRTPYAVSTVKRWAMAMAVRGYISNRG